MEGVKRQTSFSIESETYYRIQDIKKHFKDEENIRLSNSAIVDKAVFELFQKYFENEEEETNKNR